MTEETLYPMATGGHAMMISFMHSNCQDFGSGVIAPAAILRAGCSTGESFTLTVFEYLNGETVPLNADSRVNGSARLRPKMIGIAHGATFWITVANLLYLVSYSIQDIWWLRAVTVVAALLLIPYYAMQPVPLVAAIGWNVLFIAINAYWIVRLVRERILLALTWGRQWPQVLPLPNMRSMQ
jgi:hypothetical protein